MPTAVAMLGDMKFVLDTGNNRILAVDAEGHLAATLDSGVDPDLILRQPMSIASDGSHLFVANSLAGEVLVLNPTGKVDNIISLNGRPGDKAPRPIGVAGSGDGRIIVSDADNHLVLILDADGQLAGSFGTGTRAGGS